MDLISEWLNILLRTGHVPAAITWIGTSFYFNWFDVSVRSARDGKNPGLRGTLTEAHAYQASTA